MDKKDLFEEFVILGTKIFFLKKGIIKYDS